MILLGLDRDIPLSESVEAIPAGSLAVLGSGGCNRLLLRGGILAVWSGGSAISDPGNNGGSPEEISSEAFGRRRSPGLFFLGAFDTFDKWTVSRDVLNSGCICPPSWDGFLLLG